MAKKFSGDRIILKDLGFYGYHGVMGEEKSLGQRFFLDLKCGLDLSQAATTDQIGQAVSYAAIYDTVKTAFETRRMHLIEAVAQNVIDALFAEFAEINWVKLRVRKPEAPIAMVRGEAAIELRRYRKG